MNKIVLKISGLIALLSLAVFAPASRADDFSDKLDLSPLKTLALQNNQTTKTLDTYARQLISYITGHATLDGHDSLYTLLDMSLKREDYIHRNIIRIANVPLREEFEVLEIIDDAEKKRIVHDGTVSLTFMKKPEVRDLLQHVQATQATVKSNAVSQLFEAQMAMEQICFDEVAFIPAPIIPPGTVVGAKWIPPMMLIGFAPDLVDEFKKNGVPVPPIPAGYEDKHDLMNQIIDANIDLMQGWVGQDADKVNRSAKLLAEFLPKVNPAVYPSLAKRQTEVVYNKLMMLTIPGAAFYFIAFVLFLVSAQSEFRGPRLWGLRFMAIALAVHTTGICIRWWLVGSMFPPIKNEFESVMFSAWFGAVVGLILELRKFRGLFGAAASFIGTLSLVAIFTAPYVTGKEIGGEIAPVQGILMSYWLYIHVTMVTASYALMGMGFVLSAWWLVKYYHEFGTLRRVPGNLLASDAADPAPPANRSRPQSVEFPTPAVGGAMALNFAQTLAMMFFFPVRKQKSAAAVAVQTPISTQSFLARLDQANLVVLQLAFWVLGTGIILGAIWADQSWGRPWGWDPKETFALVTWMIYLIAVHVRVVTVNKAWWTAVLGCVGFGVMLFNWIGVNFLLVGLHSYA